MEKISLDAPAKINLYLRVISRRSDGYHNIESLLQAVDLYDIVRLERSDIIELECDDPSLPLDDRNLAFKAAAYLQSKHYFPGVRISLTKRIPSGAGLGGGASDAAFVLRGLCHLYGLALSAAELSEIAAGVGSDAPFFLSSGQALVQGRGEIVKTVSLPLDYEIIILSPPISIATADVYRSLKSDLTKFQENPFLVKKIGFSRLVRLLEKYGNDLEPVVLSNYLNLGELKRFLLGAGAFYSAMTGSGSSFFGLFAKGSAKAAEYESLKERGFRVCHCRPILVPPYQV